MKRNLLFLASLAGGLLIALLVLLYEPTEAFHPDALRLVCLMPPEKEYYWGKVREGLINAGKDFNCQLRIASYDRYDVKTHVSLLKECHYYHVDGIITIGEPSSKELCEEIATFTRKGIPVALMDTDAPASNRSFYIGTDNFKAGQEAATQLLSYTGGDTKAGVIITGIDNANQRERLEGFTSALEEGGGELLFVYENQSDKTALGAYLGKALDENEGLNALFDAEASTTSFLGLFLTERGKGRPLYTIGFDEVAPTAQMVAEGVLSATFIQQGRQMGYEAVKTLLSYIEDPAKEPTQIYTQAVLADAENVLEESQ